MLFNNQAEFANWIYMKKMTDLKVKNYNNPPCTLNIFKTHQISSPLNFSITWLSKIFDIQSHFSYQHWPFSHFVQGKYDYFCRSTGTWDSWHFSFHRRPPSLTWWCPYALGWVDLLTQSCSEASCWRVHPKPVGIGPQTSSQALPASTKTFNQEVQTSAWTNSDPQVKMNCCYLAFPVILNSSYLPVLWHFFSRPISIKLYKTNWHLLLQDADLKSFSIPLYVIL